MISSPPPIVASGCLPVARRATSDVPSSVSPLPTAPFADGQLRRPGEHGGVRGRCVRSRSSTTPVTSVAPRARTTAPMAGARRCARIRGLLVFAGLLPRVSRGGPRSQRPRRAKSQIRHEAAPSSLRSRRSVRESRILHAASLQPSSRAISRYGRSSTTRMNDEPALQERQPSHRFCELARSFAVERTFHGEHARDLRRPLSTTELVDETPLGHGEQPSPHRARRVGRRDRRSRVREDLLRQLLSIGVAAGTPQQEPIEVTPVANVRVFDHCCLHSRQQIIPPRPDDETTLRPCRST